MRGPASIVVDASTVRTGGGRDLAIAVARAALRVRPAIIFAPDRAFGAKFGSIDGATVLTVEGGIVRRLVTVGVWTARCRMMRSIALSVGLANRRVPFAPASSSIVVVQNKILVGRFLPAQDLPTAFRQVVLRWSLTRARLVVAVSGHLLTPSTRTVVLENGVDPEWSLTRHASDRGGDSSIVYPSHFISYKNQHLLLEAYSLARSEGLTASLLLIGDIRDSRFFTRLWSSAEGIDGVRFLPRLAPDELRAVVSSATGVVFPSLAEASPVAILEAKAVGLPLAMSDIAAHQWVASPGDRLFDPHSVRSIADALLWLASAPSPIQGAVRTWGDVERDYEDLFRRLVA